MEEKLIEQIQKILTEWNPLEGRSQSVQDLDNYKTEAIDIIFNLEMEDKITASTVQMITREVVNEAFNLDLTKQDCKDASLQIYKAVKGSI